MREGPWAKRPERWPEVVKTNVHGLFGGVELLGDLIGPLRRREGHSNRVIVSLGDVLGPFVMLEGPWKVGSDLLWVVSCSPPYEIMCAHPNSGPMSLVISLCRLMARFHWPPPLHSRMSVRCCSPSNTDLVKLHPWIVGVSLDRSLYRPVFSQAKRMRGIAPSAAVLSWMVGEARHQSLYTAWVFTAYLPPANYQTFI